MSNVHEPHELARATGQAGRPEYGTPTPAPQVGPAGELASVQWWPAAEDDADPDTDPDNDPDNRADTAPDAPAVREVLEGRVLPPFPAGGVSGPMSGAVSGVRVVRAIITSDRSVSASKVLARHVLYVPGGALSLTKRLWEAGTTSRHQRMMRSAELSGNAELLSEWETRAEAFRNARHRRTMDWIAAPFVLAKGLIVGTFSLFFFLLGLGILLACARRDAGALLGPIVAFLAVVNVLAIVVTVAWTPLVVAFPWIVVAALWNEGRRRSPMPSWLATASEADVDVAIDERTIAQALLALRIPQITAALKVAPLQFITPARRDGRGTHAVVRLPAGVTAEQVATKRAQLAGGLYRQAKEVWPTTGAEAGILDLWAADKGALADGAGEYPLLSEGKCDVFKGVPFGKTLRGEPVVAPIMERNTIGGGMPGQGKSSAARDVFAGAALDPTAELRIWVPDANFDFEAFKPRCSRYVMGAEDEKLEQIVQDLRDLHSEVQARGELLVKYQVPSVTRELASKDVGLHPLLCLLEEAHVLIQHPDLGKEASRLLVDIVRLGRKRGIHLFVSTQAPTKDSMPRDVTRNCSNGIAFAVGDHVANDALLGQGAFRAGHRATELIPGTDRGTAVVKGFSGQRSEIVQVYFIDVDKDNDQITPIIERAMKAIADRGRAVPGTGRTRPIAAAPAVRDLLADLDQVLGADPVPAADVPALLARAFPGWRPYRELNGKSLRAILANQHGIKVPSTGNRYPLDPATVRDAIARRPDPGTAGRSGDGEDGEPPALLAS
ncbi:cell division protein FtsK [Kineosporia mesophila]|uniref:Cell division protein FtsK n=1 Tax=Kineosporia mesophila TaxID=566012 RepID=A0ABP7AHX8_9ACTN|nr:hypothetical protein [Kineosporia mesophila]MCD5350746.1 hypothetical protein [Kineosporia mesophila]